MYKRKNRQNEIPISIEDVELILGKNFKLLDIFLNSTFCKTCDGQTLITEYKIYLDDVCDIIFDGKCSLCHDNVSRYVETGVSLSSLEMARHIRMIKTEYTKE